MSSEAKTPTWLSSASAASSTTLASNNSTDSVKHRKNAAWLSELERQDSYDDDPPESQSLPPKILEIRSKRSKVRQHATIVSLLLVLFGPIMFGILATSMQMMTTTSMNFSTTACDLATMPTNRLQRAFTIDLRLGGNLSYSSARMIDLAWDTVVSQMGRIMHGWLLQRHIIAGSLTRLMEISRIPYSSYIDLSFDTVSLSSLYSTLGLFGNRPRWRKVTSACWYLFAIGYVLAFSSLWSAATGYVNPSKMMYVMPDGSLVDARSDQLSLCWSTDGSRFGAGSNWTILSPTFDKAVAMGHYTNDGSTRFFVDVGGHDFFYLPFEDASENFNATWAYMLTKRLVQSFLNESIVNLEDNQITLDRTQTHNNATANATMHGYSSLNSTEPFPPLISGWQLRMDNESLTERALHKTTYRSYWMYGIVQNYSATYVLNDATATPPAPAVVPYNSTLWYNSAPQGIGAPFLEFNKDCNVLEPFNTFSPCMCYRNEPVKYAIDNDHVMCMSESGYAWGFSSTITAITLCLEFVWLWGCWGVWLDAQKNSKLLQRGRNGGGPVRSSLDLAETVQRDLGPYTSTYTEAELRKALNKQSSLSIQLEESSKGTFVGLRS